MDNWQIVGILMILAGITLLAVMAGFIINIIVDLLKLVAVLAGVVLIAAGVALLSGWRWMRRREWLRGSSASST